MYEAINNYVIVEQSKSEQTSTSGIIFTNENPGYKVVATTEQTKALQGKEIVFTKSEELKEGYESVHLDNIVAVCVV